MQEINSLNYLGAFLTGLLVSFTPCVYSMIPVVVSYIGARSAKSFWDGFRLSLNYCLGVAFAYSALGVFAALTGKLFGQISVNPKVNLVVGIMFIFFGLSILEVFEMPAINLLGNRSYKIKPSGFGAFVLGLTSGFVVSPCVAPAMASILVFISTKKNLFFGATLMFCFSLGMSATLFFIGTFSSLINFLPKSGSWQNVFKKILGLVLLGVGVYYIFLAGQRWI